VGWGWLRGVDVFSGSHPRVAEFVLVDASNGGVHQGRRFQRELENLSSRNHIVCGAETREQAWMIPCAVGVWRGRKAKFCCYPRR
jgi:hypothetical protein